MKEVKKENTMRPVIDKPIVAVNLIVLGLLALLGIVTLPYMAQGGMGISYFDLFIIVVALYMPVFIVFNLVAYYVKKITQSIIFLTLLFLLTFIGVYFAIGVLSVIYSKIESSMPVKESKACLKAWAAKDGIQLKSFAESPIYNEQGKIKGLKIDLEIQNNTEYSDGLQIRMASASRRGHISRKTERITDSDQTINNIKPYQLNKITHVLEDVGFTEDIIKTDRENEKVVFSGWIRLFAGGAHIFYDPNHPNAPTDGRKCDTQRGMDDTYFEEVLRSFPMTSREYKVSDFVETVGSNP